MVQLPGDGADQMIAETAAPGAVDLGNMVKGKTDGAQLLPSALARSNRLKKADSRGKLVTGSTTKAVSWWVIRPEKNKGRVLSSFHFRMP